MRSFLLHLLDVRNDFERQGLRLGVVQLGDMFELLYPDPYSGKPSTRAEIIASHPLYEEIIELMKRLGTIFITGNHDYSTCESESFLEASIGGVHFEHGFQADNWYQFSNPDKQFWDPMMRLYSGFRRYEARLNHVRRRARLLRAGQHSALGVISGVRERNYSIPPRKYSRQRLKYYMKKGWALHSGVWPSSICVTAHSHSPILYSDSESHPIYFIDAGAWTEGRSDFAIITNREISVCSFRRSAVRVSVSSMIPSLNTKSV
jgi:hypothetical protein